MISSASIDIENNVIVECISRSEDNGTFRIDSSRGKSLPDINPESGGACRMVYSAASEEGRKEGSKDLASRRRFRKLKNCGYRYAQPSCLRL